MPFKVNYPRKARRVNLRGFFRMARSEPAMSTADEALAGGDLEMTDDVASDPGQTSTQRHVQAGQDQMIRMPSGDETQTAHALVPGILSGPLPQQVTADTEMVLNEPPIYNVKHPLGIVDYHLYLACIEKGKDATVRRNSLYLYDGTDCEPVAYHNLFEDEIYTANGSGSRPQLLFAVLPIADKGANFSGKHYVLCYDWRLRTFLARSFNWLPGDIRDIWAVWSEGLTVYTITIPRLFSLLQLVFLQRKGKAGEGILSSSPLCRSLQVSDDPGMEMVIATLFIQFAEDFVDVIFIQEDWHKQKFRHQLNKYEDQCRRVLQCASYRAWFAIRSDASMGEKYSHKDDFKRFINDLYTFEQSEEEIAALMQTDVSPDTEWPAPSLEACELIRNQIREQRREAAAESLEKLFAIPDDLPTMESPGQAFERMMTKAGENPTPAASYPPGAPRTPSPRFRHRSTMQECLSPGSPGIVCEAEEDHDGFEVTEYHKIPLELLLRRTLDLLKERPELDSFNNRGRFGTLYTDIGICVRKKSTDKLALAPPLGYENDSWKLTVQSESEPQTDGEADQPRRLLPAPRID
ncbi:uncharacterized protein ACLA_026330 [Aspergillus clavatus NRRL 1]|uniref:Uncharacterized protein n=1 Tax=Aspergillus clavatus (strain ATCC 1007 / CBS 513.65 / DSM 816 / NCTC 3887 / NRRL 1 / QM 1276 / 107) TaxID=344612 RepID=A1CQJ5_ASPCL|nr:uncharacterized protein ACLA_026330 [Aspergillus clavatus NRRL 1]EAW07916.1 conserved hypothetical protein [Aspergillus clavatus NRRL 1]